MLIGLLLLELISDEAGRRNETAEENCFLKIRKPSKHGMYEHMSASMSSVLYVSVRKSPL